MCTWRVLAMLRRVACVGVCHLSPHHTTRFCCAAAGCTCPSMRKHGDLCNSNNLDTKPSLYIYVHRGRFFTSIFSDCFAKIADDRQQTTSGEQNATVRTMCACRIPPVRRRDSCFCHSRSLFFFFFFFYPPADGEKSSLSSPHFHVFSYASCVDLT